MNSRSGFATGDEVVQPRCFKVNYFNPDTQKAGHKWIEAYTRHGAIREFYTQQSCRGAFNLLVIDCWYSLPIGEKL